MADNANISTWDAFCGFIENYSKENDDFALIALNGGGGAFRLPLISDDRLITCSNGPNAVLNAAGMAADGKRPWIIGSSAQLACKSYPQIREALAIPSLPVRIAVYDGGLSDGRASASEHIIEDAALMRSMPNMSVLAPSDEKSLFGVAGAVSKWKAPVYLRLSQIPVPLLKTESEIDFTVGGGRIIREGSDVTICACGIMTHKALKAAEILEQQGISVEIVECYSIKPFPEAYVLASVRSTGCCVVAADHTSIGGLGGAVAESLSRAYPVPVRFSAIEDRFVGSGTPEELREYYGLTWQEIVNAVSQAWALRRR